MVGAGWPLSQMVDKVKRMGTEENQTNLKISRNIQICAQPHKNAKCNFKYTTVFLTLDGNSIH